MEKKLSIHSENILPIIKKWLYSDKDIFLRELVSNSCDAITKLKLLSQQGKASDSQHRIDITIDKEKKTLTISDTGLGMTEEELDKYISQIAFSGAEDFFKKYSSEKPSDQIIGHFGLGFYSAYMVASSVDILTKSYTEAPSVLWSCDGSSSYTVIPQIKEKIGTDVILHIAKEEEEFLEKETVKRVLKKYCPYLPYPIFLDGEHINNKDPLYLKNASEISEKEYLDFYKELYPFDADPVFWIHINIDFPFPLKGILYFPKITQNLDPSKSHIKLFCSRVFVSDNCKDVLPDHLIFLKGAIDSAEIPLNVSRSFLQMDANVRQLGTHITKKIADRLSLLHKTQKELFVEKWKDIEPLVKLTILHNDKFYEKAKSFLIFENTNKEWVTIEEYLTRNPSLNKKVFYTQNGKNPPILELYKEKNIEVLYANTLIDPALFNYLESELSITFQRIDGAIDETLLQPDKDKDKTQIASLMGSMLDGVKVEVKNLASSSIFGFVLIEENQRRLREYFAHQKEQMSFPLEKTFVVNTNSPLLEKLTQFYEKNPLLAKKAAHHLYKGALLAQNELSASELEGFSLEGAHIFEQFLQELSLPR